MERIRFSWDEKKNAVNLRKHGITFEEASTVFYDDFAIEFDDPDYSAEEERFLIIGYSQQNHKCIVSYCYRDSNNII